MPKSRLPKARRERAAIRRYLQAATIANAHAETRIPSHTESELLWYLEANRLHQQLVRAARTLAKFGYGAKLEATTNGTTLAEIAR